MHQHICHFPAARYLDREVLPNLIEKSHSSGPWRPRVRPLSAASAASMVRRVEPHATRHAFRGPSGGLRFRFTRPTLPNVRAKQPPVTSVARRYLDGHAELSCGRRHSSIKCDQHDIKTPRDREVQRVRGTQREIKPPNIRPRKANIHGMDFRCSGNRCSPHVKIGQAGRPVCRLKSPGANEPRHRRGHFRSGEIADPRLLLSRHESVDHRARRLFNQDRKHDAGVEITGQRSSVS
jgi:hypothetical protein